MKTLYVVLMLALAVNGLAGEKEIVKGNLTDVIVYSQGAQLSHKASFTVKAGVTEVIVEGISAYIDAKSIQVKAMGNVVILDSRYSLYYPKPEPVNPDGIPLKISKEIKQLGDSIKWMNYDIQEIQDEIDILEKTKAMISNNGSMRGQGRVSDSLNFLKNAVEYYGLKMTEINKKKLALNKKLQEKNDKLAIMQERYAALEAYQNGEYQNVELSKQPIPRVIVTLQASEAASGKMTVSYLVSNAGWTPLYDLRSEASSGKINLTYKAQVFQSTGLDWNEVKLSISTNNPYANKTKPELSPWYLDYVQYRAYESDNANKRKENVTITGSSTPAFNMGYSFSPSMEDKPALTADEFTTVVNHLISAEFKIDLPYTIKSNNEMHIVFVKQTDLDTKFRYYAVPKMDPSVYLVAQMTKMDELQLVPAKANIFFEGTYIGETYIDPTSMDDTLNLSLGKDPNIVVKRTLLKKDLKDKIVAEKRERTFNYSIEVRNLKSSNIELYVQDQIPITQNGDIIIENINPGKGKLDEPTGLIEWIVNIKPKESKTIEFGYKVKHDKDKQINLQ